MELQYTYMFICYHDCILLVNSQLHVPGHNLPLEGHQLLPLHPAPCRHLAYILYPGTGLDKNISSHECEVGTRGQGEVDQWLQGVPADQRGEESVFQRLIYLVQLQLLQVGSKEQWVLHDRKVCRSCQYKGGTLQPVERSVVSCPSLGCAQLL